MADAADNAGAVIEHHLSNALARHQLPVTVAGAMDIDCEECGTEIPKARRQAAPWATTCIDCQSIREARGRHVR
ncbi:TraR/DksA C4-type zinc finger protein [Salinicola sp. LHM]|uniref:TraR/DksA C4-type zinc finger protein n=1 Tax=Salinicola sp. LHM TaxID=3065298 RepID=UPI002ACF069B|nr:TraR/DksA C4-type zinc finger protein [Salinicola sp. LHM]WQH33342.1 TraR/DksA C4-type zinc finger protein [Salinicola sp. LHM]